MFQQKSEGKSISKFSLAPLNVNKISQVRKHTSGSSPLLIAKSDVEKSINEFLDQEGIFNCTDDLTRFQHVGVVSKPMRSMLLKRYSNSSTQAQSSSLLERRRSRLANVGSPVVSKLDE